MTARMIPAAADPARPAATRPIAITVDGETVAGVAGQTIGGILLAAGRGSWRTTSAGGRPRGVFCGIGVCFDCIVTVNGLRDVRACRRRAAEGDVVQTQHDALPGAVS
ncbi:(2Fe-2S)-binding protein [Agromyces archimandritae]|uniref:(2Fe-2S)-binding protein n=1 Tax=Agromyces archimandritae TaxID=2781962 RepID=A0A975FNT8_9MICO|nr:(2Fe-2S)-binding protein [Agromyces archimandritae]QTX05544.1 (2Fe-2S)-binding protein [Agromyces archimandritae]